ncbi:MAG: hypothetical protein U5Q44_02220 [Dehalococcoidia bacterium]|nr:hypothetical protein [Dehalococcoidia bacterium]
MLPSQLEKVRRLRAMLDEAGLDADIEIDGGVKLGNAADCVSAGANVLVCGSSVYNDQSAVADNLAALRKQVDAAVAAR